MRFVRQYLIPRLVQYVLVIYAALTVVFFLPRLLPTDPVESLIVTMMGERGHMDPAAVDELISTMREIYGLEAGLFSQYLSFWQRLFTGDFGPSLFMFPTPVFEVIGRALPWTVGLLLSSTLLGWIIGNLLGGLSGYFSRSRILKIVDGMAMLVRPIPFYIVALTLIILFAFLLPLFPLRGAFPIGMAISFTWSTVWGILKHAFLPVMSMVLLGAAVNHQTMRLLIQSVKDEDYVKYAKIGNVKEGTIFGRYVMRNALLPQVTALAMMLGMIFGGALIVEIVFSYPGVGALLFQAIMVGDYTLLMGIMTISIVAIATGILIIDLLYPLIDPRIRLK